MVIIFHNTGVIIADNKAFHNWYFENLFGLGCTICSVCYNNDKFTSQGGGAAWINLSTSPTGFYGAF
jgi:hypothetical protein